LAPITLSLAPDYSRGQLLTTCYIIDNYSPNTLFLDSEDGMGMLSTFEMLEKEGLSYVMVYMAVIARSQNS
jgi:hypothetical protein